MHLDFALWEYFSNESCEMLLKISFIISIYFNHFFEQVIVITYIMFLLLLYYVYSNVPKQTPWRWWTGNKSALKWTRSGFLRNTYSITDAQRHLLTHDRRVDIIKQLQLCETLRWNPLSVFTMSTVSTAETQLSHYGGPSLCLTTLMLIEVCQSGRITLTLLIHFHNFNTVNVLNVIH